MLPQNHTQNSTLAPAQSSPQPTGPTAQPVYPNQVQAPAMQLNPAYGHDKLAIASLILGIVSLPASILTLFTLSIPVIGIVLGIISFKRKKSFAITGIILSVIGIILSAVFLIVGLHIDDSKDVSQGASSQTNGVSGSTLSSTCYSFSLPEVFTSADVTKNANCGTQMNTNNTDDLAVIPLDLSSPVSDSDRDSYLKNLVSESQVGSGNQITSTKFVTLDGVRAYQGTGTENDGNYKYFGVIAVFAPKDYVSVTGVKSRAFVVVYDSATSQDRLDKLAQSWHWQ